MPFSSIKEFFADFITAFDKAQVLRRSAALAYYTLFSLPGLLLIVVWISDLFYRSGQAESALFLKLGNLIGESSSQLLEKVLLQVRQSTDGYFARIAGLLTLFFGASGIFVEIQQSMNLIWDIQVKPVKGKWWVKLLTDRVLSFSMVAVLGFLLLVSLLVNSLIDLFLDQLSRYLPNISVVLIYASNFLVSFLVIVTLFALIFRVLPDARVPWKEARSGILATAVLFMVGRVVITFLLGHNQVVGYYGPAGALLIILLWVYFSAVILYTGAILTRLNLRRKGKTIRPQPIAFRRKRKERIFNNDPGSGS
ncbi:MAG: YihY/virulence factor BrkB family protein [Chitinophagaceae bacterium]|nr:YihY/virulence factor BrkB family protein [Chitinophagaceae bacterium]